MAKLNIISSNVRGLGTQHKRTDVMHYLENLKCDIVLLQDTHLTTKKIPSFNALWKGKSYHSCFTNNSRGSSILLNSNLQHELLGEFVSNEGNYILLHCQIGADSYLIGSIYGPNRDEPKFYEDIGDILGSVDCDHIVIGGDFNFIIDADKDCYGYARENNVNARKKFMAVCNKHNLIDVWRFQNPRKQAYTWFTATHSKGSRLDMFFVSNHLANLCSDLQINPGYRTDHSNITMCIQTGNSQRGPGLWKFNESLLHDEDYIEVVNECIGRMIYEYSLPVYTREFLSHESNYKDIQFQIDDGLFYETLLMMIRGETVKYSKIKAKRRRVTEKELISQIELAHAEYSNTNNEEVLIRLKTYNEQLEAIRKPVIDGLIVRSRTRWHEKGEKASKYFLGLEKRNALRKTVTVLKVGDDMYTRTSSILQKFTQDLTKKYSKVHKLPSTAESFIAENVCTSLSTVESDVLEKPLSLKELTEALHKMKKGKSPGSNGYTACFFKHFWAKLGPFLYRAFVFCNQNGKKLLTHSEGVITMIPKAGKHPDSIKGWRPITLLNIDFKIISAAVSARLQSVAGSLIDQCQTAYIKGRFIGENTRLIYDVISHLVSREGTGLIMSADFEAAFDSISWNFICKVLDQYGFGPKFRRLINVLYLNTSNFSRIILNGHLGDKIYLKCGIRQGDPASGYLFNLAVNILSQQIKRSSILTGINISESIEVRISQYADDTVLFLKNSSNCIEGALQELKIFSEASGLRLNIEKTSCMQIGVQNQQHYENSQGIKWVSRLKILGVSFTTDNNDITQCNFEPKLLQIEKEIEQWRRRNITPIGRITVIKSLLISKLVHLFTALPNPSQTEVKRLERILFQFLWAGKRDPVKRAKIVQDFSKGGLRMIDVQSFLKSMKISWLKRLYSGNTTWGQVIANEIPNIEDLLTYGSKKLLKVSVKINNPFWQNVLEAFASFSTAHKPKLPDVLTESIWFSDYTKFKCSVIPNWKSKGIRFIADLINERSGNLHTKESLENTFQIKMTFLCFASLVRSLPDELKSIKTAKEFGPIIPLRMNLVINHPHFSHFAYDVYIENRMDDIAKVNTKQKSKWVRDIGCFEDGSTVEVIKATKSTRSIMFQYKLVNRFLATNTYLKIIRVKDDESCTFCKQEPETLAHMFWYCPLVQAFIIEIKTRLLIEFRIDLDINRMTWFFLTNLRAIEICIITLAKRVIYETRLKETCPNYTHLKNKLKFEIEIECQAARMSNTLDKFDKKWGPMKSFWKDQHTHIST